MTTRNPEARSHHAVTHEVAVCKNSKIMGRQCGIVLDLEKCRAIPAPFCNQLKEILRRDMNGILSKSVEETLREQLDIGSPKEHERINTYLRCSNHSFCLICRNIGSGQFLRTKHITLKIGQLQQIQKRLARTQLFAPGGRGTALAL